MKSLKMTISLLVMTLVVNMFSMVGAADISGSAVDVISGISLSVKYGATDTAEVREAFEDAIQTRASEAGSTVSGIKWASWPTSWTAAGTVTCTITYESGDYEDETVPYTIVSPAGYEFKNTLTDLYSSSSYNATKAALLSYVNSDLVLVGTGTDYTDAVGTAPTYTAAAFSWDNSNTAYAATGATYTFQQTYAGYTVKRVLTVTETSKGSPTISIDYDNCTVSTTDTMVYSLDKKTWKACTKNMTIPSAWYGISVYFRYPATNYYGQSAYTKVSIPERYKKPTAQLNLVTAAHSITITNCWDFDNCEYSLDGENWKTTTKPYCIFYNLKSNTSYKVYVRACSDGNYFVSEAQVKSVKTTEDIVTGISVDYSVAKDIGYVNGVATIASEEDGTNLTGSLSSGNLIRFKSIVGTYLDDYASVSASLKINQYAEGYEKKDLQTVTFSMPLSPIKEAVTDANLQMEYHCDLVSIQMDNDNLAYYEKYGSRSYWKVDARKITSFSGTGYSWMKQQISDDRPVYYLSVGIGSQYDDTMITYSLPYTLKNDEIISGIQVYLADKNGDNTRIPASFNAGSGTVTFTTDETGYFVISYDSSAVETLNFTDVPTSHWAYSSIKHCYNKGLFAGVSNTKFDLTSPVTRGTIVTLLARLDGYDTSAAPVSTSFTDIKLTDWYTPGANWAYEKKLVTGKTFSPNDTMKREDIALLLYNYLKTKGYSGETKTQLTYTDTASIRKTNQTAVAYLKDLGIMSGNSKGAFDPGGAVTRAEMAAILNRLSDVLDETAPT